MCCIKTQKQIYLKKGNKMVNSSKPSIIPFLVVIFSGCASTQMKNVNVRGSYLLFKQPEIQGEIKNTAPLEGRPAKEVEVFYKREPKGDFEEVGMVEAVAQGQSSGLDDLIPELQTQAGKIRADGIIKIEVQRYEHDAAAIAGTAVAIRFVKKAK